MDYKELSRVIRELSEIYGLADEVASQLMLAASTSIIDLLARAEAAEARCETVEKMVKEYQDTIVPGYRERAEKAEREGRL